MSGAGSLGHKLFFGSRVSFVDRTSGLLMGFFVIFLFWDTIYHCATSILFVCTSRNFIA